MPGPGSGGRTPAPTSRGLAPASGAAALAESKGDSAAAAAADSGDVGGAGHDDNGDNDGHLLGRLRLARWVGSSWPRWDRLLSPSEPEPGALKTSAAEAKSFLLVLLFLLLFGFSRRSLFEAKARSAAAIPWRISVFLRSSTCARMRRRMDG